MTIFRRTEVDGVVIHELITQKSAKHYHTVCPGCGHAVNARHHFRVSRLNGRTYLLEDLKNKTSPLPIPAWQVCHKIGGR